MRDTAGSAAAPPARCRKFRRGSFMMAFPSAAASLDHLVGAGEHCCWDLEAESLGGLQVEDDLVLGRRLHGEVGRSLAPEDTVNVAGRLPVLLKKIRPIRDQAAGGN